MASPATEVGAQDGASLPRVRVRWRQLPGDDRAIEDTARAIASIITGHLQRPSQAPVVLCSAPAVGVELRTAQSDEPLTYVQARHLAGVQWVSDAGDAVRAVTTTGEVIEMKRTVRASGPGTVGDVNERLPRRPMKANRRPGSGGLQRRTDTEHVDPTEGLEQYGELTLWAVDGGATIGTIELDPNGNAVVLARLSTEEKRDQLIDQVRPCLALAEQNAEILRPRLIILALRMSGTREVRPERAAAAPNGILERDDILLLDEYLDAGWVEHVIARGGDRLARDTYPLETLLHRWKKAGVGLWLSDLGRRMDYATDSGDRMLMRTLGMISAEERAAIVLRLQRAHLNKGALAGKGHLGPPPFGFVRDKTTRRLRPDPQQWPFILRAFEIADSGVCLDGESLSTRRVSEVLAEEGCPFDHDRVRKILKDIRYATGEFVVNVRGVPVAQDPIQLDEPVPLDRFERVQGLLRLRKGGNKKTPIGEFLFNAVACVHAQCEGEIGSRGLTSRVNGYVLASQRPDARIYRHSVFVPDGCRNGDGRGRGGAFSWERRWLEPPVVRELQRLATHPEVVRQLATAARHTLAKSTARLTPAQRAQLEREIEEIEARQAEAVDSWIDRASAGSHDLDGYRRLMERFDHRLHALRTRLDNDKLAATADGFGHRYEPRVEAFLELMSEETPEDPMLRQLRARLFQQIVSRVVIDDCGSGPITITLEGHLIPDGSPLEAANPILAAGEMLDSYVAKTRGGSSEPDRIYAALETDLSALADKSVSMIAADALGLPSVQAQASLRRATLDYDGWHRRMSHCRAVGEAAWRTQIAIEPISDECQ